MSEVTLKINGRGYSLSCDDGQENRLEDLAGYVNSRLKDIASSGAATSEAHLLVLTSLVLADEIYDLQTEMGHLREQLHYLQLNPPHAKGSILEEEVLVAQAIDHLAHRIEYIAGRIQMAA